MVLNKMKVLQKYLSLTIISVVMLNNYDNAVSAIALRD